MKQEQIQVSDSSQVKLGLVEPRWSNYVELPDSMLLWTTIESMGHCRFGSCKTETPIRVVYHLCGSKMGSYLTFAHPHQSGWLR